MKRRLLTLRGALIVMVALMVFAVLSIQAQVTFDQLLRADRQPSNWLTYSGSFMSQRYSLLTQITPGNVKNLELQWLWQSPSLEKYETTSIVVDGILYTVQAPTTTQTADGNTQIVALDAATGRPFWRFTYQIPMTARACCGRVNRGLAILGDTLYMGTLNSHLIAVNAKNGTLLWDTTVIVPPTNATYPITVAPLIVKDKVIIGTAGGDGAIRGFLAAYDAKTGKEVWRFYTTPGPGEPGNDTWSGESWKVGGAGIWTTGSYDPETNLTFWGTGNPNPTGNGPSRLGDNLYSDSVVALDADTGKLKWHYQFTPHDEMDYDSTQVPVLADIEVKGKMRKAMLWANRNGLMYVLDRTTGEFIQGRPFVKVNWMDGFDAKGRPQRVPGKLPGARGDGTPIMPTILGATNWYSPSFSPKTGLFYVPAWENSKSGGGGGGGGRGAANTTPMGGIALAPNVKTEEEGYGVVRAFDPRTLDQKWEFKMNDITWAGVLSTAGDVVFSGGREGYFFALDARDGKLLWKMNLGGQVNSGPMSYSVNGRQYIAVAAGTSLFSFALRQ
jgi:alcohol dehydrogenase (cytochrome c)